MDNSHSSWIKNGGKANPTQFSRNNWHKKREGVRRSEGRLLFESNRLLGVFMQGTPSSPYETYLAAGFLLSLWPTVRGRSEPLGFTSPRIGTLKHGCAG